MNRLFRILSHLSMSIAMGIALISCASIGGQVVRHSFEFDLAMDNQDAAVLDYRYGDSKLPVSAPRWSVAEGKEFSFTAVTGPMRRGDTLYVKWRNRETGKVFEDTVDLRSRLPNDITGHTIYFMIRGPQLYVYLVPPADQKRRKEDRPVGPAMYASRNTVMIYPDQQK